MTTETVDSLVELGNINGVFGIQGWVKVFSHTSPRVQITDYRRWLVRHNGQDVEYRVLRGIAKPENRNKMASIFYAPASTLTRDRRSNGGFLFRSHMFFVNSNIRQYQAVPHLCLLVPYPNISLVV